MNAIYKNRIRKKVIENLTRIGIDSFEIILDIELSEMTINSIEWIESENSIIVHVFSDDIDYYYEFDELNEEDRLLILTTLIFY